MKILCLIDSLGSGGAQRQMVNLAEILNEMQYDISFLVYHQEDFFKDKLDVLQIPIYYILEQRPLYRIFKVRRFIRNGNFDAVISFMDVPNFLNNFAAIGGRTWKVITSERSSKESFFFSKRGRIFSWFYRYSDSIVCNSQNSKNLWLKYYPEFRQKLTVIYNPVLIPVISSKYDPLKNGKLNVLIASSYQYLKNPIGLIKSLAMLNPNERELIEVNWYGRKEVIQGDTRAYDESIKLIEELNLEKIIHLNTETKDIARLMHESDIIALFSRIEGLPNAICEGMMLCKPIIMSRVSDFETLVDKSNGFLCDWNNPNSIKEAIVSAINLSIDELVRMGESSRIKAHDLFSQGIILNQWLKLLHRDEYFNEK